jgi:hypothetical protein
LHMLLILALVNEKSCRIVIPFISGTKILVFNTKNHELLISNIVN